ncbi:MAG TPA: protein kinase [Streptosporangiaceae bacterium]
MNPDLSEGQTFGAYRLIGLAGTGGMGVVYQAEQQQPLRRIVAFKVIRPEVAGSSDYQARFLREARLAATVNHPHIVPVFDFGEHAGRLYLAMQWIDGVELGRLMGCGQLLAPERAVRIGTQVASALQAIHNAGMLHRDVKPANILVRDMDGEDHAYLTDFGIAKLAEADGGLTRTGWMIGTTGYLSPEQIQGQQPDGRSDLYALGCVMFEALTGQRPFTGDNDQALLWAHASSPRPVASQVCPGLGRRYDEFFVQALAANPHDRYQSGHEFGAALEAACAGRPPPPITTTADGPAKQPLAAQHPPGLPLLPETETAPTPPAGRSAPSGRTAGAGPGTAAGSGRAPGRPPTSAAPGSPGALPGAGMPGVRPRAGRPARGWAGRLIAVAGCLVFLVSLTVLHRYVNNGTGWKSLWEATHGDIASPLYAKDFWIPAALAAFVLIGTTVTIPARTGFGMGVVAVAALASIGYTLYIPAIGRSPGFAPYGTSYWLSLAAAVVMAVGAAAAGLRSGARRT